MIRIFRKPCLIAFLITAAIGMTACDIGPKDDDGQSATAGNALIANTDYSTGSISSIDLDNFTGSNDNLKGGIDSDLRIRVTGGRVYVINRTNGNIMRVNPENKWEVLVQKSLGGTSNPGDIIVNGITAYISFYGNSSIWIADPDTLEKKSEISLSAYNPSDVTNPSIDQMWLDTDSGYLYVSMQRLDSSWVVATYSDVIVINTATNTILKEIKLQWKNGASDVYAKNPYSKFVYASKNAWVNGDGHDHLLLLCTGTWSGYDGGIIAIDTTDLDIESGFVVSESYLSADISDFDYNGKFYVSTSGSSASGVSTVAAGDGEVHPLLTVSATYSVPFVKLSSTGLLFAGDRKESGVWIFDTNNSDVKKNSSVISTGLPPCDITFMK